MSEDKKCDYCYLLSGRIKSHIKNTASDNTPTEVDMNYCPKCGRCLRVRDPNRIEPFVEELGKIWKEECSDWRFGQLISNVIDSCGCDIWFIEDDEMMDVIRKYFDRE